MNNEDIERGQHCWAQYKNSNMLLVVLKYSKNTYYVCGGWEFLIHEDELDLISIIPIPCGHKNDKLYYMKW